MIKRASDIVLASLILLALAHLVEGRVLYRSDGSFSLRVVATSGLTAADEAARPAAIRLRFPRVEVRVEQVAAIARGTNGTCAFLARDG